MQWIICLAFLEVVFVLAQRDDRVRRSLLDMIRRARSQPVDLNYLGAANCAMKWLGIALIAEYGGIGPAIGAYLLLDYILTLLKHQMYDPEVMLGDQEDESVDSCPSCGE